ncbi:helix-hairpin-helix domain-containing protein [Domibacillus sp. A3M-37]|uniref:helix-hairpin-helix domain-containing protein n=1 Tax=Domibacillus sp. A3M-37 TaxID=2962037 RepID=UPI0020B6D720|nr:helix-hairpin-helix domain-containing protein [Domibacillus sp. A3M-37]MCP3764297.1 helix-hairpin-helix domain-containing protein [Domibacillus sp. A3M-37]
MNVQEMIKKYKVPAAGGLALAMFWLYGLTEEDPIPPASEPAAVEEVQVETDAEAILEEAEPPVEVAIDVKGAVSMPGIYMMSSDERVNDAINKAGGLTEQAEAAAVNLAQKVQDEMVIYVPAKGEEVPAVQTMPVPSAGSAGGTEQSSVININTADSTALQELPGIGESKAQAIIDFRETDGPFTAVEDLKNISGIGDKTFEKLAPLIKIK